MRSDSQVAFSSRALTNTILQTSVKDGLGAQHRFDWKESLVLALMPVRQTDQGIETGYIKSPMLIKNRAISGCLRTKLLLFLPPLAIDPTVCLSSDYYPSMCPLLLELSGILRQACLPLHRYPG